MDAAAISVCGGKDPGGEARSLLDWLRRENALRGQVALSSRASAPGEMGGLMETVSVALGAEATGVALAGALTMWLRGRTADIRVRVEGPRGTVDLDVRRARDVDRVVEDLIRVLKQQDG